MSHGVKVVKPNTRIDTTIATNIVVDSRAAGAMKIAKKIVVEQNDADLTSTFYNGAGVKQGIYTYAHNLGYAPAFLMYQTEIYDGEAAQTRMLPEFGAFGAPGYINAASTPTTITVTNLNGDSGENGRRVYLILYVFAENLDAEV